MQTDAMKEQKYHIPALLKESIDGLNIRPDGVYVDTTFGGGGHSRAILAQLNRQGRLLGFDQDSDAMLNKPKDNRFVFVQSNFRYLKNWLRYYGATQIDGLIADLGVSSHHFDEAGRGFSFRFESNLDMRMNRQSKKTAADILNTYSEEQLADIFFYYGELKQARRMARKIVIHRQTTALATSEQLIDLLKEFAPPHNAISKFLAKAFQALRIEVNDEINALSDMLLQAEKILKPGGRLCIISYHSLEDRLVKNFLRSGNFEGKIKKDFYGNRTTPFEPINRKVIVPNIKEQEGNPRSRSAKLRIAERKKEK